MPLSADWSYVTVMLLVDVVVDIFFDLSPDSYPSYTGVGLHTQFFTV